MNRKYLFAYLAQLAGLLLLLVHSNFARLAGVAAILAGGSLYRREERRIKALRPAEYHPSALRRISLSSVAIIFIVPCTLGACFGGIMLLVFSGTLISGDRSISSYVSVLSFLVVLLGWFGLQTLWALYFHFLNNNDAPERPKYYWLGLLSGGLVSIFLILSAGGSAPFRFVIFGWPLLPAMFFSVMLLSHKAQPNKSFKPNPLRGSA